MSGLDVVEIDKETVTKLRQKARKSGGSIAAVLSACGMAAYSSLAEKHSTIHPYYSSSIAVNCRSLITDSSKASSLHGTCTYQVYLEKYKFKDNDSFWNHVGCIKQKLNGFMRSLAPFVRTIGWIPVYITYLISTTKKITKKRDSVLLLSNVGVFSSSEVGSAPDIKLVDLIGTSNSYWRGNRALFQMTAFTLDGCMKLTIVYPAYMVTKEDCEFYVENVRSILHRVADDMDATVKNSRVSWKDIIDIEKQEIQVPR